MSDLKNAIRSADTNLSRVLLRSLVTICYAHWEGYVRFAARKYLEHVALRKFAYRDLDRQFVRNHFLPRLAALSTARSSIAERCVLIDEILSSSDHRFSRVNENLVNTKANLSFDVFAEICLICHVPLPPFSDKATFIDVFLLKRRNAIAHGEDTYVGIDSIDELTTTVIELMRFFGDALENHVYSAAYKSADNRSSPVSFR